MTSRKRVSLSLSHKEPDRVPIGYWSTVEAEENLKKYLNIKSKKELLKRLGVDYRFIAPKYIGPRDLRCYNNWDVPGKDTWGVERRTMKSAYSEHREIFKYPLKEIKDVEELEKYPWPKIDWFDFEDIKRQIEEFEEDDEYSIVLNGGSVFEVSWYMRGMDNFLMDLLVNRDIADKIIEKVFSFYSSIITESIKVCRERIDIILFGDDIASQSSMLISADLWRKMIKPWHKKFYKLSHDYGKKAIYHSCGAIEPIIEDLIEIGLDVLNPLQFSAKGFPSPEQLKEKYGDKLCFEGGMDIQTVLPFCSVEEIKKETERLIRILGKDGGYTIQSTHYFQLDTPPQNIMAMYDTALKHSY